MLLTLYFLLCQGVMSDLFLMPAILNIARRYNFSKSTAGVCLALGVSTPELIVTIISFQSHGVKMAEFAIAMVFGGMVFASTLIPVVAYTLNYGCRKPRPPQANDEKTQRDIRRFKYSLTRDLSFAIGAMICFYFALGDQGAINSTWVGGILGLFVVYIVVIVLLDWHFAESSLQRSGNSSNSSAQSLKNNLPTLENKNCDLE